MANSPEGGHILDDVSRAGSLAAPPDSLRDRVREAKRLVEAEMIRDALEKHQWNRRLTAQALQISYRSLMYRMKNCNLRNPARVARPKS